jgi:hypothetical protein
MFEVLKTQILKLTIALLAAVTVHAKVVLPAVEIINSEQPSVDMVMKGIYTGAAGDPATVPDTRSHFVQDLTEIEVNGILELIQDKTSKNSDKELILVRYTMGDKRVSDAIALALKSGIMVSVVTDFNPVMTYKFSDPNQQFTSDFAQAKISNGGENSGGQMIRDFLAMGLKFNETLFSQPLYNSTLDRTPIMHEKALLLKSGQRKTVFFGSANLSNNPRYNRIYRIEDSDFYDRYKSHVDALKQTYANGMETKKIPFQPRTLIIYKDGSEIEMSFTDGKYNPNERIKNLLETQKIEQLILSHFVITHRGVLGAIGTAFEKNKDAKGFAITDDKFSELDQWGLGPALAGFDITDPFKRSVSGLDPSVYNRISSFVYQRQAIDPVTGEIRIETYEDGPPTARHVWHDKTTIIDFQSSAGDKKSSIFTGSFNLSNNSANSEFQAQINLSQNSWIRNSIEHSIKSVVLTEPTWAIPNVYATLRNALGMVFGLTDLEIPLNQIEKLMAAVESRNSKSISETLVEVSQLKGNLSRQIPQETKTFRLKQFFSFLNWYYKSVPFSKDMLNERIRRMTSIAIVIANPMMKDYLKANIVSSIISRANVSVQQQEKLIAEAFRQLGLGLYNPWSGLASTILSLDKIFNPLILNKSALSPEKTLKMFISELAEKNDFTWKGESFDAFFNNLASEKQSSLITVINSFKIESSEVIETVEYIKSIAGKAGVGTNLYSVDENNFLSITNPEKIQSDLILILSAQAKKGIISTSVSIGDAKITQILKEIKANPPPDLKKFKIVIM